MWGRELSENRELHVRGFIFRILEEDQGKAIWNFRTRVYEPGCVRAGPPGVPVVSQSAPYHGEATLSQVSYYHDSFLTCTGKHKLRRSMWLRER